MSATPKLSLFSAILININIMLGSGIFINTVVLTKQAGSLGFLVYALVGVLLLPLILAIATLLRYHPDGGTFYHFGASVSPFVGFLSSWSYFTAKLASCGLGIHVCVSLLQQIIPALKIIPTLGFDILIITLFALLNMLNMRMGQSIQYCFMGLKLIPITFAIFAGLFLFSGSNFTSASVLWQGIPASIPLVLYAFSGFEASCSLSASIEDSERNGPKAIFISYLLVIGIVMLYQLMFFGSLGTLLGNLLDYREAFPAFLQALIPARHTAQTALTALLHIGIASSSLGASYGIMYSNSWNLVTIAQHNHTFGASLLTAFNRHQIPFVCVIIEALLACIYVLLSGGNQVPLQQVGACGSIVAYSCSSLALLVVLKRTHKKLSKLALLSIGSCIILTGAFILGVLTKGLSGLVLFFATLVLLGSIMFNIQKQQVRP